MKNTIFLAASIVAMSGLAYIRFSNELSDDEYKEFLVERTEPCCGNGGGGLDRIPSLPDTNRFLRLVLAHGPKANQYGFVTNAIHEIEAQLSPE